MLVLSEIGGKDTIFILNSRIPSKKDEKNSVI
jgi:hypothetical protein